MKSLSLKNLDIFYGDFHAVKDVSIDVARGEFIALLGPSGCGKTSLLRSIAGFVAPRSGDIRIGGSDISGIASRDRNLGIVFQSYALFPHMTALDNVSFGLECRHVDRRIVKEQAMEVLEMVGLTALADRKPRQLSGGQQQRVALARALLIKPDILLLDEPLGALDRKLRLQMQVELKALQERLGVTTVMVTHDQEEAMVLADKIAVMRDGFVEQIDAPDDLFSKPKTRWVADFMGAGSVLKGRIQRGSSGPEITISDLVKLKLDNSNSDAENKDVAVFLRADEISITPAENGKGLQVTSSRFLGFNVEIQAERDGVSLRALIPASKCIGIEIGSWVSPHIDRHSLHIIQEH